MAKKDRFEYGSEMELFEENERLQALNAELLAALKNEMAEERRRYQNSPKAVAFFEKNNAEALALIARAESQQ